MKYMAQLFGAIGIVGFCNMALAECPPGLTAEKTIECIIAEADCQAGSVFLQATTTAAATSVTDTQANTVEQPSHLMMAIISEANR